MKIQLPSPFITRLTNTKIQSFDSQKEVSKSCCFSNYSANGLEILANYNISFGSKGDIPFYAISEDGKIFRFTNKKEACKELDVKLNTIYGYLSGSHCPTGKYSFIYADGFETIADDGTIIPNKEKLIKMRPDSAFFVVNNKTKEYKRFTDKNEAAGYAHTDYASITRCLSGTYRTTNGFSCIKAKLVEVYDSEKDCLVPDVDKLMELSEGEKPFYAVYKNGTHKKYYSRKEAKEDTGVTASALSSCLNKRTKTSEKCIYLCSRSGK